MPNINKQPEDLAVSGKSHYMAIWESHVNQLANMINEEKAGGLTYERYVELKAELMKYAEVNY